MLNAKAALGQTSAADTAALADHTTKLAKNIQLDLANAGKTSMTVPFVCPLQP